MFAEDMSLVTDNNIDGRKYIRCKKYQNISYVKNERNAEGQNGNILSPDKLPQSIIDSLNKIGQKQFCLQILISVRLEAIKQCALQKKAEKDKITQALRKDDGSMKSKNHIIFSDNDLAPEVSDNFNLFVSDEDYNNNEKPTLDIAMNKIFEGESGRERLNSKEEPIRQTSSSTFNKRFIVNDRFKLTSDFVSNDENIDTDENNIKRRQI
ncbi:hypothetical protein C2G38_2061332 [Gigaspora rosea]|uniref:Uncharacterized protein n=1 Tax=Gigaspora rosea TaxID=44941 RepID=A0A397W8L9_9GLOM|nr:hypothetical protein C2G38_2061332 [Gigaspora rosea]